MESPRRKTEESRSAPCQTLQAVSLLILRQEVWCQDIGVANSMEPRDLFAYQVSFARSERFGS